MRKLVSLSLVLVLFATVFVPLIDAEDSDAVESVTFTLPVYSYNYGGMTYHYYYSEDKQLYSGNGYNSDATVFYTSENAEAEFNRYARGEANAMNAKNVYPSVGSSYYVYIKSYQTSYYDINTWSTKYYDDVFTNLVVEDPDYECIEIPAGSYTISIRGDYQSYALMRVNGHDVREIHEPSSEDISISGYGSYYLASGDYSGMSTAEVTIRGSVLPSKSVIGVGTTDAVCRTDKVWMMCTLTNVSNCWTGGYVFEKDSAVERSFFEEVVKKDSTDFNPGEYPTVNSFDSSKTYVVYEYTGGGTISYQSGDDYPEVKLEPVFDSDNEYSFYVGPFTDVTVAVSYDSSQYRLYIDANNGISCYLHTDREYTFNGTPSMYTIYAERLVNVSEGASTVDFKISIEGNSEPSDDADIVAAAMILICIALFAILGFSGLKPKWSKKE